MLSSQSVPSILQSTFRMTYSSSCLWKKIQSQRPPSTSKHHFKRRLYQGGTTSAMTFNKHQSSSLSSIAPLPSRSRASLRTFPGRIEARSDCAQRRLQDHVLRGVAGSKNRWQVLSVGSGSSVNVGEMEGAEEVERKIEVQELGHDCADATWPLCSCYLTLEGFPTGENASTDSLRVVHVETIFIIDLSPRFSPSLFSTSHSLSHPAPTLLTFSLPKVCPE